MRINKTEPLVEEHELVLTACSVDGAEKQSVKKSFENNTVYRPSHQNRPNDSADPFTSFWMSTPIGQLRSMSLAAEAGLAVERNMTFLGGCRLYPTAVTWSLLLSLTIVMEAYDKSLISSFFAFPAFREAYGRRVETESVGSNKSHQISTAWQTGLTNGAVCAEVIGLLIHGYLTERFGYHNTMIATLVWMCLAIFLAFFATNIEMLLASQILCGIPWGVIQTLTATYAADVLPVALRPYLQANVNNCWLIGQLVGAAVIRGIVNGQKSESYLLPFALQWAWAVPLLIAIYFAPESPWWLIRHGKPHEARKSLQRLTSCGFLDLDKTVAMMIQTNKFEKRTDRASTYLDCFKGTNLRRTEIACMVWVTQALCGSTLTGYAAYFYEQAGFSTEYSFNLSVGMYGMAIIGGIISWFLIRHVGRRSLYLGGLGASVLILLTGGIVSVLPDPFAGLNWVLGSLVIFMTFLYDMTIGPVCYILVAEIPSTRLRLKTVVLARVTYNIAIVITNVIAPLMLNPESWDWKGKSCFVFASTALVCLVWCYSRLPETQGLAYIEMDILFDKKAPTKKFKTFQKGLANSGYFSIGNTETSNSVWHGSVGYA